jgi:amidase
LLWSVLISGYPPEAFDKLVELAATFPENAGNHVAYMSRYGTARHRDWLGANEVREQMRAAAAKFFDSYDVLLMPVNQVPAIPHDHSEPQAARQVTIDGVAHEYYEMTAWIALATALFLPATAIPVGRTASGLPVGMQIVAPYLEDFTGLDFAARAEQVLGGFEAPPGFE